MRVLLRVLAGLALVTGGILSLAGGVGAWALGEQRSVPQGIVSGEGDDGAFMATIAPVHTDGYAIVVPDVAGVLARHGMARHLGDGRLTVTVRSASAVPDLVVVALVPAADAARYLSPVARTEVVAVGYATGVQPVQTVSRFGTAPVGFAPWDTVEPGASATPPQAGRLVTVALDLPASEPVTLVVRRWDNAAGLTATITVGFAPASWETAMAVMLIAGAFGTLAGLALLVLRRPWIDPLHPMVADLDDDALPLRPARRGAERPIPQPLALPARRRWPPRRAHPAPAMTGARHSRPVEAESPYVHTAT